ncbi:MAG: DUF3800 domain-containing protein [Erysipelotrichales bacterium]
MVKYFCVDESGSYHTTYERYYIISGIITSDIHSLQRLHRKVEQTVRSNHKGTRELKGANLSEKNKALFINELTSADGFSIVSLILDKKVLLEKHEFKMSEFLIFNHILKELTLFSYEKGFIDEDDELIMMVDARVMNHKVYYDLEALLNLELFNKVKSITVLYKDSAITREIQYVDYVSNVMYGYFNKTNNALYHIKNIRAINYKVIPIKE